MNTVNRIASWSVVILTTLLASCVSQTPESLSAQKIPEIHPGMLQGYIPIKDRIKSVNFVPTAPKVDSDFQRLDDAVNRKALSLHDTPRWELAAEDGDLRFPAAANRFACALNVSISEKDTPELYMLLRRTLTDIGLATYSAKKAYQRPRPFMTNGAPICTPADEEILRNDGSYPSGHTAIGWGWALILAELAPDRAEKILARGRAFGESRVVCNVHWYSDVVAGRMVAGGAVAALHTNEQFKAAMQAAGDEIQQSQKLGLIPDAAQCEKEQKVLSVVF